MECFQWILTHNGTSERFVSMVNAILKGFIANNYMQSMIKYTKYLYFKAFDN